MTKPGFKTTEFWVTMLVAAGGIALIIKGDTGQGVTLISAAAAANGVSRGLAKK